MGRHLGIMAESCIASAGIVLVIATLVPALIGVPSRSTVIDTFPSIHTVAISSNPEDLTGTSSVYLVSGSYENPPTPDTAIRSVPRGHVFVGRVTPRLRRDHTPWNRLFRFPVTRSETLTFSIAGGSLPMAAVLESHRDTLIPQAFEMIQPRLVADSSVFSAKAVSESDLRLGVLRAETRDGFGWLIAQVAALLLGVSLIGLAAFNLLRRIREAPNVEYVAG